MITVLAGGVGAAKLLAGLIRIVKQEDLTIIVNTGDDLNLHGLHISPDLDTIIYTLADIVDVEKGWGIKGDTFQFLDALKTLGLETWFGVGDRDLATHIYRTEQLKQGRNLSEVTSSLCNAFGVTAKVLPMTDYPFETRIITERGSIHFQDYLVKQKAQDKVLGVEFVGAEDTKPAAGVIEAIQNADSVVICPSNPIVSIGTILSINGVRSSLRQSKARKVAVSPIVAGSAIKGPAGHLLEGLKHEVSAFGVAELYSDFLDVLIIDIRDSAEKERIERLGVEAKITNTIMHTLEDKTNLARIVLEAGNAYSLDE